MALLCEICPPFSLWPLNFAFLARLCLSAWASLCLLTVCELCRCFLRLSRRLDHCLVWPLPCVWLEIWDLEERARELSGAGCVPRGLGALVSASAEAFGNLGSDPADELDWLINFSPDGLMD